ncbi:MAG: devR 1, partial [Nocardioides sp.]|nr:devR 1 [Nocardioides sp.]
GLTNRQIGEQMFLAEKTIKNYVSSILAKLGLERRTQAAVLASRLLGPSDSHR